MKVLLVNSRYAPYSTGGADISTRKLAVELVNQNHIVEILSCGDTDTDDTVDGITVHRRKFHNIDSWFNYPKLSGIKKIVYKTLDYYNLFNIGELKKILRDISPDVIHTNNTNGISPVIWHVSKQMKIPVIHTCRDYFLLCHKTTMVKNGTVCESPSILCELYRLLYKHISNNVDCVTAPSRYTLNCFTNEGYFSKCQAEVVYNAIDLNDDETKNQLEERKKRVNTQFKFLYLGAVERHKGVDILVKAFKSIENDNVELYIAGNGSMAKEIEKEADERIHYLGFLGQEEMRKALRECDVLVCPSNWPEPFGRVIIDAYRYAMPVISSDIGGLSEIVSFDTGYQVKPGNIESLKGAMTQMCEDREIYLEMCDNAARYIKRFSVTNQALQLSKIYSRVKQNGKKNHNQIN